VGHVNKENTCDLYKDSYYHFRIMIVKDNNNKNGEFYIKS